MHKKPSLPTRWPMNHYDPLHFEEVEEFLTSAPVTVEELHGMAIATGGAQAARSRGVDVHSEPRTATRPLNTGRRRLAGDRTEVGRLDLDIVACALILAIVGIRK